MYDDRCEECRGEEPQEGIAFESAHGRLFEFCCTDCKAAFVARRSERAEELYSLVTDPSAKMNGRRQPHGQTAREKTIKLLARWREDDAKRDEHQLIGAGQGTLGTR